MNWWSWATIVSSFEHFAAALKLQARNTGKAPTHQNNSQKALFGAQCLHTTYPAFVLLRVYSSIAQTFLLNQSELDSHINKKVKVSLPVFSEGAVPGQFVQVGTSPTETLACNCEFLLTLRSCIIVYLAVA